MKTKDIKINIHVDTTQLDAALTRTQQFAERIHRAQQLRSARWRLTRHFELLSR